MNNFDLIDDFTFKDKDKEIIIRRHFRFDFYENQKIIVMDVSQDEELSKHAIYAGSLAKTDTGSENNKLPKIFLGKKYKLLDKEQQDFVYFHEVGHIILKHNGIKRPLEQEIAADNFSIEQTNNYKAALEFLYTHKEFATNKAEIMDRIDNIKRVNLL